MKPVHQTIFGNGEGPGAGNCVQAALASVLELDLDDVPHFVAMGDDWFERMQWAPMSERPTEGSSE